MTVFDHIKNVTENKTHWDSYTDEEKNAWVTFPINRALSMHIDLCEIVNDIQYSTGGTLEPRELQSIYRDVLPKKLPFAKYIKREGGLDLDHDVLKHIADWYSVSRRQAFEYLVILRQSGNIDEIKRILASKSGDESQVEKWIKQIDAGFEK